MIVMAAFQPIAALPSQWEGEDGGNSPIKVRQLERQVCEALENYYGQDIHRWNQLANWIQKLEEPDVHPL